MQYGNIKSYEAFIKDHMEGEESNLPVYLKGLSTILGLDYFQSEPLYPIFDDNNHPDVNFKLGIYLLGATDNKDKVNGFLIYLYDVEIKDDQGEVIEKPIIKLTITFDEATHKLGYEYVNYASNIFYPDNTLSIPFIYMFDTEGELKKVDEDVFSSITRIQIEYSTGEKNSDGYIYNDQFLFLATYQESNDELAFVKELNFTMTPEEYRLREQFEDSTPSDEEMISFGLVDDKFSLKPYNWIIWRTIIIYTLIILVITYFLFFHKKIMEKRKFRHIDQSTKNSQSVNAEPIFRDPEPTPKDGK
jgi:hypothetical protein